MWEHIEMLGEGKVSGDHGRRRARLLVIAALIAALVGGCGGSTSEGVGQKAGAQTIGECLQDALDFEKAGAWTTSSGAGFTLLSGGRSGNFSGSVPAGTHTIQATMPALFSTWAGEGSLQVFPTVSGADGEITVTASAPGLSPTTIGSVSFDDLSTGAYTKLTWFLGPLTSMAQELQRLQGDVTLTLAIESSVALSIDELRFGDLVCERCNPPRAGVPSQGGPSFPPPAGTTLSSVTVRLPTSVSLSDVALGAGRELRVNDRARVLGATPLGSPTVYGTVANAGLGATEVGVNADVGNIHVARNVFLRYANVRGDLRYGGTLTSQEQPPDISGQIVQGPVSTGVALGWSVFLPNQLGPAVSVPPGNANTTPSQTILPGSFGNVVINSYGLLHLDAGTYVLDRLQVEPNGILELDNADGEVILYIRSGFEFKGRIFDTSTAHNILFVYLGQSTASVTNDWHGSMIAPNAKVVLDHAGGEFFGSVFANDIELHQDGTFEHRPFAPTSCEADWLHVCGTEKPGCVRITGCDARMCVGEPEIPAIEDESCYLTEDEPVWGFADLHAHPATELGWGRLGESPGMFAGSTGTSPDGPFLPGICAPDIHSSGTGLDFISHASRRTLVASLEGQGRFAHGPIGPFDPLNIAGHGSWPSAQSVLHQQMRLDWVRRAYDGGLRLMFAAVADNRLLSRLWNNGFNLFGNSVTVPAVPTNAEWDLEHATDQLEFIHQLAQLNSSWMEIVDSPAAAREAIRDGKLAVVLSLEMDTLDLEGILELKEQFQVAHVIPIHLSDNQFGGSALYSELFEANSWYLNGGVQMTVENDPTLNFRLGVRTVVQPADAGAVVPRAYRRGFAPSGLQDVPACSPQGGHKNFLGLTQAGTEALDRLMKEGMFIDVSHMSDKAATEAIATLINDHNRYPVMASHTGVRGGAPLSSSERGRHAHTLTERELTHEQVRDIAERGGTIGVGTPGDFFDDQVLADVRGGEVLHLSSDDAPTWEWLLQDRRLRPEDTLVESLALNVRMGNRVKQACSVVHARVGLRSGGSFDFVLLEDQAIQPRTWARDVPMVFPQPVALLDITSFELGFDVGGCDPAFDFVDLKVTWEGSVEGRGVLVQRTASVLNHPDSVFGGDFHAGRFMSLHAGNPAFLEELQWNQDEAYLSEELEELRVHIHTGADDLRAFTPDPLDGSPPAIVIESTDRCGDHEIPLPGTGLAGESDFTGTLSFAGSGLTVGDLGSIYLRTKSQCPDINFSLAATIFGAGSLALFSPAPLGFIAAPILAYDLDGCVTQDNWYLDRIRIEAVTASGVHLLAQESGRPFAHTTGKRTDPVIYEARNHCKALSLDDNAETVLVHLHTGLDLPSGADDIRIRITRNDGVMSEVALNPSVPWSGDFLHSNARTMTVVKMPPGTKVRHLHSLIIDGGGTSGWDLDRIQVSIPGDPMDAWNDGYRTVLGLMGGRGVALGTDLNGFQHQMPFSNTHVDYPFDVPAANGATVTTLDADTIGQRTLSFDRDGIAHYGMLADMARALRNLDPDSANRLFRSADDVIQMWERIEARKEVFRRRAEEDCESFGPPFVTKVASGVGCQVIGPDLPSWWGTRPVQIALTQTVSAPIDVIVTPSCAGQAQTISLSQSWQMVPLGNVSTACPLTLRFQGEPEDSYSVVYQ